MVTKFDGEYICGYCKKSTYLSDKELLEYINDGKRTNDFKCSCGHHSYASTIRFKARVDAKDWRFGVGSCE